MLIPIKELRDRSPVKAAVRWLVVLVTVMVVGGQIAGASLADNDAAHLIDVHGGDVSTTDTPSGHGSDSDDTHQTTNCFVTSCPQLRPVVMNPVPDFDSREHRPVSFNRNPVRSHAVAPDPFPPKPLA
jgi:hypothetical protein